MEKLKLDEFSEEYLAGEMIDELEGMRNYNEDWWEGQRLQMLSEEAQNLVLSPSHTSPPFSPLLFILNSHKLTTFTEQYNIPSNSSS